MGSLDRESVRWFSPIAFRVGWVFSKGFSDRIARWRINRNLIVTGLQLVLVVQ